MPIEAFSVISCATPPTENSHLANKQYVDEAVASASGGGSGASDRLTTNSQGVYAIGPPNIGMSTYLVPQTAIAAEYSAATTYQIGDICTYQGELWRRNFQSGKGVPPSTGGMLWQKVLVTSLIPQTKGCDQGVVNATPGSEISLSGYPGVVKIQSSFVSTIGALGLNFGGIAIGGMLSLELHIDCSTASPTALPIKWSGSSLSAVWLNGSIDDIKTTGKTHVVRLRYFAGASSVILEYLGGY